MTEEIFSIRANGGAGYILNKDGENFFVVSIYKDKKIAQAVTSQNNGVLQEISLPLLTFSDKTQANEQKKAYDTVLNTVETLLDLSLDFDNGRLSLDALKSRLETVKAYLRNEVLPFSLSSFGEDITNDSAFVKFLACEVLSCAVKYFAQ